MGDVLEKGAVLDVQTRGKREPKLALVKLAGFHDPRSLSRQN
jgi:hypothetical protein